MTKNQQMNVEIRKKKIKWNWKKWNRTVQYRTDQNRKRKWKFPLKIRNCFQVNRNSCNIAIGIYHVVRKEKKTSRESSRTRKVLMTIHLGIFVGISKTDEKKTSSGIFLCSSEHASLRIQFSQSEIGQMTSAFWFMFLTWAFQRRGLFIKHTKRSAVRSSTCCIHTWVSEQQSKQI